MHVVPVERVSRRAWAALTVAASNAFVVSMSVTSVNVAFAAIERDFETANRSTLSWGLTGYSISLAALMLLGGRLADHVGRRRIFRIGIVVFVVASACLALAPSAWWFVIARIGQAIGAALSSPSALALVIEVFPSERRLSAISTWAAVGTLGSALGPSFSAVVTETLGWRWVFVIPLAFCLASLAASGRLLPHGRPAHRPRRPSIDVAGAAMGTAAVALAAGVITEGPRLGWLHPAPIVGIAVLAVLVPLFVRRCAAHEEPFLDVGLFRLPNVKAVNLVNVSYSAAGTASWLLYPLVLIQHSGYSLVRTGLALTPFPIVASATGLIAARLAERVGTRRVIFYGAALPAIGLAWQAATIPRGWPYAPGLLLGGAIFNLGFGIVYSPVTALGLRSVPTSQIGQATAAFNALRQLGGGLGVATIIAVLGEGDIPLAKFEMALAVSALMASVGAVAIVTMLRVPVEFRQRRRNTVVSSSVPRSE